tara:strand:+ start:1076 stop:1405 length:330 start_codon:yes stop_codon:yes gene_type:complete
MKKILMCCLLGASMSATAVYSDELTEATNTYQNLCSACHGADGKGVLPGVPDFTKADGRLSKTDAALASSILDGFKSPGSPMAMPPKGGMPSMSQKQADDLVKYLKLNF